MALAAVLDASVLYGEVVHNLVTDGRASQAQASRLTDAMATAFDGAAVPQHVVDRLEPAMINHPKDRHVLAAALVSDAHAVVTLNGKDFPAAACEPFGVEPLHPDDFLLHVYELDEDEVFAAIARQAAALTRPPLALDELLDRLAVTVPRFARALRARR
jgi:hypothetical protein